MTHKFPGTPTETKVAEFLVASTGGHFVTVIRPKVGELLGVSIRGATIVIRDMLAALPTDAEPGAVLKNAIRAVSKAFDPSSMSPITENQAQRRAIRSLNKLSPPPAAKPEEKYRNPDIFHDAEGRN